MQKTSLSICSAILALTCIGASAQSRNAMSGMYIEADYTQANVKINQDASAGVTADTKVKPSMYKFIVGAEVHPNLAIEGMLASGGSDNSTTMNVNGTPTNTSMKINSAYGVYLKPKFNVTNDLELFGRIGYNRFNLTGVQNYTSGGIAYTDTLKGNGNSVAYGIGVKYNITREWSAVVDYMQYLKKDDTTINGLSFGLAYNF